MNSTLAISARPQPDTLLSETVRSLAKVMRTVVSIALVMLCAMNAMNAQNIISTVAGGGTIPSAPLSADIPGPTATIKDSAGNLYIAASFSTHSFKLSNGVLTVWRAQD